MKSNEQMITEVTSQVALKRKEIKKRRIRFTAFGITVVLLLTAMIPAVTAARKSTLMDLKRDPASHIERLPDPAEVEALRAQIDAAGDPFSPAGSENPVLLDRTSEITYGSTVINHGYVFIFRSLIDGKAILNKTVAGSIFDGDAVTQDTVEYKKYAVVDVMREDGKDLTEEDLQLWFYMHRLVAGYEPWSAAFCLACEPYTCDLSYADAKTVHYLIDITDMTIFADRTLALALATCEWTDLDHDVMYANKKGNFAFHENALQTPHALFYFDLPDSSADADAVKRFEKTHGLTKRFSKYYKD